MINSAGFGEFTTAHRFYIRSSILILCHALVKIYRVLGQCGELFLESLSLSNENYGGIAVIINFNFFQFLNRSADE